MAIKTLNMNTSFKYTVYIALSSQLPCESDIFKEKTWNFCLTLGLRVWLSGRAFAKLAFMKCSVLPPSYQKIRIKKVIKQVVLEYNIYPFHIYF